MLITISGIPRKIFKGQGALNEKCYRNTPQNLPGTKFPFMCFPRRLTLGNFACFNIFFTCRFDYFKSIIEIIKEIPEDPANMPRDHISPKLFSADLITGTICKNIVSKAF